MAVPKRERMGKKSYHSDNEMNNGKEIIEITIAIGLLQVITVRCKTIYYIQCSTSWWILEVNASNFVILYGALSVCAHSENDKITNGWCASLHSSRLFIFVFSLYLTATTNLFFHRSACFVSSHIEWKTYKLNGFSEDLP